MIANKQSTMVEELEIRNPRTGDLHHVTVHPGNYVDAADISKVCLSNEGPEAAPRSLRILDRGYLHTACVQSKITHIDGQRGSITYRSLPIQELFRDYDFEQVMHLLIWGDIPSRERIREVRQVMAVAMKPSQVAIDVVRSFSRDTPTYSMLMAGMSAYTATDALVRECHHSLRPMFHGHLDKADPAIMSTLAYYASTVALVYCHRNSREFQAPSAELSLIDNLLHMMGESSPELSEMLNKLWILYADHEMTASTAAVLHTGATLADPVSSIISGIATAYGPLHAGAIHLAYEQLENIGSVSNIPMFITAVKAKATRLFGYGHRIYRARDPRLGLIEELMVKHEDRISGDPLLKIARQLEAVADNDEYFVKRNLRANADLKGCFLYTAFGFDVDMIVAIIGLSRVSGAMAHWRESQEQSIKLWRPQQIYTGQISDAKHQVDTTPTPRLSSRVISARTKAGVIATVWDKIRSITGTAVGLVIVSWYGFNDFSRKEKHSQMKLRF